MPQRRMLSSAECGYDSGRRAAHRLQHLLWNR